MGCFTILPIRRNVLTLDFAYECDQKRLTRQKVNTTIARKSRGTIDGHRKTKLRERPRRVGVRINGMVLISEVIAFLVIKKVCLSLQHRP